MPEGIETTQSPIVMKANDEESRRLAAALEVVVRKNMGTLEKEGIVDQVCTINAALVKAMKKMRELGWSGGGIEPNLTEVNQNGRAVTVMQPGGALERFTSGDQRIEWARMLQRLPQAEPYFQGKVSEDLLADLFVAAVHATATSEKTANITVESLTYFNPATLPKGWDEKYWQALRCLATPGPETAGIPINRLVAETALPKM